MGMNSLLHGCSAKGWAMGADSKTLTKGLLPQRGSVKTGLGVAKASNLLSGGMIYIVY